MNPSRIQNAQVTRGGSGVRYAANDNRKHQQRGRSERNNVIPFSSSADTRYPTVDDVQRQQRPDSVTASAQIREKKRQQKNDRVSAEEIKQRQQKNKRVFLRKRKAARKLLKASEKASGNTGHVRIALVSARAIFPWAGMLYLPQLFLAAIGLIVVGGVAAAESLVGETILSLFVDESYFLFFVIAAGIMSIASMVVMFLFYKSAKIKSLSTPAQQFTFVLACALSFFPAANLLPVGMIWVITVITQGSE